MESISLHFLSPKRNSMQKYKVSDEIDGSVIFIFVPSWSYSETRDVAWVSGSWGQKRANHEVCIFPAILGSPGQENIGVAEGKKLSPKASSQKDHLQFPVKNLSPYKCVDNH